MAARPPQALKAATPSAWLLSTVRQRPRQAREAPAVMAVVLSRMPRPLAARGAGRPRWPLGALLSEPALKIAESDSSTQQLCGSDDHGVSQQWLWQRLAFDVVQREYALSSPSSCRARSAFVGAARGRQTSCTRTGAGTLGCPGGHERWHVRTLRSGRSRRVMPRSDACSVASWQYSRRIGI